MQCMAPGGDWGVDSWKDEGSTRIDSFGCQLVIIVGPIFMREDHSTRST